MRIDSLRLENFRCFSQAEITFDPKLNLTVLVAENGQGKSSILDAVRIALWPVVSSFDLANVPDYGNGITIEDVRLLRMKTGDMARQLPAKIAASGRYGSYKKSRSWERFRESEAPSTKTKDGEGTYALKKWAREVQGEIRDPEGDAISLPVFGYYGTGRLWSQKKLTKAGKIKDDSQGKDFYVRTFAYRDCLDPASTFKHFKEWFIWASEAYQEAQFRSKRRRANSASEVKVAQERIEAIQNTIDLFLKDSTGWHTLEYSISDEKSLILTHDQEGSLNVDQLSDGIRSVLAMVGDIAYRCIKLNPHLGPSAPQETKGVVLIDEVDMHLHPRWQQTILGQFQNAFPKIQFIVTTHSPQVISTVRRESIRVIVKAETGYTISTPDFSPLAHEAGDALAKIMGTDPTPPLLAEDVQQYEQLVRSGMEESKDARALRTSLEELGYSLKDSDMHTWRFLAKRRALKGS